jgi:signal peptidase I
MNFFAPRYVVEADRLAKQVTLTLRYKKDILADSQSSQAAARLRDLREAARNRSKQQVTEISSELHKFVERVTPERQRTEIQGAVETVIVSVVLVLGIMAYFLQAFKIPTGSMQPTLNGIIAKRMTEPPPSVVVQAAQFLWLGRTYVNVVSRAPTDTIARLRATRPKFLGIPFLWDGTEITMTSGRRYEIGITPVVLTNQMGVREGQTFEENDVIVRGYADLGDHLVVEKFSYHFAAPQRGDVFVFGTKGIFGIPTGPDLSSQNYIKRIAGVPGDTLQIRQPNLFINGQPAQQWVFQRVASQSDGYTGYRNDSGGDPAMTYLATPDSTVQVPPRRYFALGDNSASSLDSRYWGFVPGDNVVGRGVLVYWPFTRHWGVVR